MKNKLRYLYFDTEISKSVYAKFPPKGAEYDNYKNIIKDWWIICAGWKRDDDKTVTVVSVLDDPKRFKKNPTDDYHVVKALYDEIAKSDVLVGHNLSGFDWKKFYARVLYHDLPPIDKPVIIDTLKLSKNLAEFTSNSLDYLTKYLSLPQKATNRGNDMWNDLVRHLLENDLDKATKVIEEIVIYCGPDVTACEALYHKFRPHAPARFKVNESLANNGDGCPSCGSPRLIKRGFRHTMTASYQAYQCKDCKSYCQDKRAAVTSSKK